MPPKKAEKKRRNKRKSRTEDVSSASSSDSESDNASQPKQVVPLVALPIQITSREPDKTASNTDDNGGDGDQDAPVFTQPKPKPDAEKVFEDFYLRQTTREFANDLDKLRSAGDFHAASVPLLISALKQGTGCFSAEERGKVVASLER